MTRWYAVPRSYRVSDEVYVCASSAVEARELVEDFEYVEASGQETTSQTRYGRARRVGDSFAETLTQQHTFESESGGGRDA
jgi:hypothetical protein